MRSRKPPPIARPTADFVAVRRSRFVSPAGRASRKRGLVAQATNHEARRGGCASARTGAFKGAKPAGKDICGGFDDRAGVSCAGGQATRRCRWSASPRHMRGWHRYSRLCSTAARQAGIKRRWMKSTMLASKETEIQTIAWQGWEPWVPIWRRSPASSTRLGKGRYRRSPTRHQAFAAVRLGRLSPARVWAARGGGRADAGGPRHEASSRRIGGMHVRRASTLSELQLALGEVAEAITLAEQSVDLRRSQRRCLPPHGAGARH